MCVSINDLMFQKQKTGLTCLELCCNFVCYTVYEFKEHLVNVHNISLLSSMFTFQTHLGESYVVYVGNAII